jgi:hypothetical protein
MRIIKSRKIKWVVHVVQMGQKRLFVGKPDSKIPVGRPRCRWVDNIKMGDRMQWCGLDWPGSGQRQVESSYERGNEPLGFMKCLETIKWQNS